MRRALNICVLHAGLHVYVYDLLRLGAVAAPALSINRIATKLLDYQQLCRT